MGCSILHGQCDGVPLAWCRLPACVVALVKDADALAVAEADLDYGHFLQKQKRPVPALNHLVRALTLKRAGVSTDDIGWVRLEPVSSFVVRALARTPRL